MRHQLKFLGLFGFACAATFLSSCTSETTEGGNVVEASSKDPGSSLPKPETKADKMMVKYVDGLDEIATALQGVDSEDAAKSAGETIAKVGERLNAMKPDWEKLADTDISAAAARYSGKVQELSQRLTKAMMPLMTNPTYGKYIQQAMENMPEFMDAK
jgi:hypothetical protein